MLVLEPLDIPSRRLAGQDGERRLLDVVRAISDVGGRRVVDWGTHPYRSALLERLARIGGPADRLRRQVEHVDASLSVATGAWHGDLNSGNVALVAGPCPVWDWERFEEDVPVRIRPAAPRPARSITTRGVAARVAAERLVAQSAADARTVGREPTQPTLVARSYLVTLACRYLADDQEAAGADLGKVHEWLLPALEEVPVVSGSRRGRGALAPRPTSAPSLRRPHPRRRQHGGARPPRPARRAARSVAERPGGASCPTPSRATGDGSTSRRRCCAACRSDSTPCPTSSGSC